MARIGGLASLPEPLSAKLAGHTCGEPTDFAPSGGVPLGARPGDEQGSESTSRLERRPGSRSDRMAPETRRVITNSTAAAATSRPIRTHDATPRLPSSPKSIKPARVPLLETPAALVAMEVARQNQMPYSSEKKRFTKDSNSHQAASNNHLQQQQQQQQQLNRNHLALIQSQLVPPKPSKFSGQERVLQGANKESPSAGAAKKTPDHSINQSPRMRPTQRRPGASPIPPGEQVAGGQEARTVAPMRPEVQRDPLPAQQLQPKQQQQQQSHKPPPNQPNATTTTTTPVVVRPNELGFGGATSRELRPHQLARRHRCRGRNRMSCDRLLKSPTIPEEDDELAAASADLKLESLASSNNTRKTETKTSPKDDACPLPSESYMVATIADESGVHSRSLVIYLDRSLGDLTRDVLKKLIEIELERRRNELLADNNTAASQASSTFKPNEIEKRMPELRLEADKLARLFKRHLESARSPTLACKTITPGSFKREAPPDGNKMEADELARPNGFGVRREPAKKCHCDANKDETKLLRHQVEEDEANSGEQQASNEEQQQQQQQQQPRDIYDFKCSCCCLHLVNRRRREDGESWCCCGCG